MRRERGRLHEEDPAYSGARWRDPWTCIFHVLFVSFVRFVRFVNFCISSQQDLKFVNYVLRRFLTHAVIHLADGLPVLRSIVDAMTVEKGVNDVRDLDIVLHEGLQFVPDHGCEKSLEARDESLTASVREEPVDVRVDPLEGGDLDGDAVRHATTLERAVRSLSQARLEDCAWGGTAWELHAGGVRIPEFMTQPLCEIIRHRYLD